MGSHQRQVASFLGCVKMPGRPRSVRPAAGPAAGQKRKRVSSPAENTAEPPEKQTQQKSLSSRTQKKDNARSLKQLTNGNVPDIDINAGGDCKSGTLDKFKYIPKSNKVSSNDQNIQKSKSQAEKTKVSSTLDNETDIFAQIFKAKQVLNSSVDTVKNKLARAVQPYCPQSVNVVHSLTQHSYGSRCPSKLKKVNAV